MSTLEHGHDDLETDEERHEVIDLAPTVPAPLSPVASLLTCPASCKFLVALNAALTEKYGEDLSCVAATGLWMSAKDPATGDTYWFQADGDASLPLAWRPRSPCFTILTPRHRHLHMG